MILSFSNCLGLKNQWRIYNHSHTWFSVCSIGTYLTSLSKILNLLNIEARIECNFSFFKVNGRRTKWTRLNRYWLRMFETVRVGGGFWHWQNHQLNAINMHTPSKSPIVDGLENQTGRSAKVNDPWFKDLESEDGLFKVRRSFEYGRPHWLNRPSTIVPGPSVLNIVNFECG